MQEGLETTDFAFVALTVFWESGCQAPCWLLQDSQSPNAHRRSEELWSHFTDEKTKEERDESHKAGKAACALHGRGRN